MIYSIGCDPGVSGCAIHLGYDDTLESDTPKYVIVDKYRLDKPGQPLNEFCQSRTLVDVVVCEQVGARPAFGSVGGQQRRQGTKSTFTFGEAFGTIKQALCLIDKPTQFARPQEWQKHFGLIFPKTLGLTQPQKKKKHQEYVSEKFGFDLPQKDVDAFLIAVYGIHLWRYPKKNSKPSKSGSKPTRRKPKQTSNGS